MRCFRATVSAAVIASFFAAMPCTAATDCGAEIVAGSGPNIGTGSERNFAPDNAARAVSGDLPDSPARTADFLSTRRQDCVPQSSAECENAARRAPRVALVYTVTTPELKADVVREIEARVGPDTEFMVYEVPEAFEETVAEGRVTARAAARMITAYMRAVEAGADVVLNICSTMEDVAYCVQDAARYTGVPVVMVNEAMCRAAVLRGAKIALVSTFPESIAPTRNTLLRVAREAGRRVEVAEVTVEGGFGVERSRLVELMTAAVKEAAADADVLLFTQGSMAYCAGEIGRIAGKEVLVNTVFSAEAVRDALAAKGIAVR